MSLEKLLVALTRICVITLIRIWVIVTYDPKEFNYSHGKLALLTDLEPLLGIINACLPVIQPILKKLSKVNVFTCGIRDFRSWKSWSSSRKNLISTSSQRLDGQTHSLSNKHENSNHITTPGSKGDSIFDDVDAQTLDSHHGVPLARIVVKRDWEVSSEV
ncbi:MAG: hypothetical protein Q9187_003283 [Circinaria calcarea]